MMSTMFLKFGPYPLSYLTELMILTHLSALPSHRRHHIYVPPRRKRERASAQRKRVFVPSFVAFCPVPSPTGSVSSQPPPLFLPPPTPYPIRRDLNSLNKIAGVGIDGIGEGARDGDGDTPLELQMQSPRYTKKRVRGSALWQWSLSRCNERLAPNR